MKRCWQPAFSPLFVGLVLLGACSTTWAADLQSNQVRVMFTTYRLTSTDAGLELKTIPHKTVVRPTIDLTGLPFAENSSPFSRAGETS